MAYWHYCIACQQWSKSSTPLSDDKTCSFCGKKYTKIKKSDETIIPDVAENQAEVETTITEEAMVDTETLAAPEENETSALDETLEDQEPEVAETIEETEIAEEPETSEAAEQVEPAEVLEEEEEETAETQKAETPKPKKATASKIPFEKKGHPSRKR